MPLTHAQKADQPIMQSKCAAATVGELVRRDNADNM